MDNLRNTCNVVAIIASTATGGGANAEDGHLEEDSTRLLCSRMPARLLLRARNASINRSVKARRRQPHRIRHDVLLRWQSDWTLQSFTEHCQLGVHDMVGCRSARPAIETSAAIPYGVRTIVIPWPLRAQRIGHRPRPLGHGLPLAMIEGIRSLWRLAAAERSGASVINQQRHAVRRWLGRRRGWVAGRGERALPSFSCGRAVSAVVC